MKLKTVRSDGSAVTETFEVVVSSDVQGRPYDQPAVFICRHIGRRERADIAKRTEVKTQGRRGQGLIKDVDASNEAAAHETVMQAVVDWRNISGADGEPLPCTEETKQHIPPHAMLDIINAVLDTEDTAHADSFRQPA